AAETRATLGAVAMAPAARRLMRFYVGLRGVGADGCLLLFGASGTRSGARAALAQARAAVRAHGGVPLGARPGRSWVRDRFRRPYLREGLLDRGYATDTVETAVPWSGLARAWSSIGGAIAEAL